MTAEMRKPWVYRLTGGLRNFSNRRLFHAIRTFSKGRVLDIGGWDFFLTARDPKHGFHFDAWTTLEPDSKKKLSIDDARFSMVTGDGCAMEFKDGVFDTCLNVCVLEHVYDPIKMVSETSRVLSRGGHAIFLIPQTTLPHMVPDHYYNFTRYWIEKVMPDSGLKIVQLQPVGGLWQDVIAHFFYFVMYTLRAPDHDEPRSTRNILFWILLPFMAMYALVSLPVMLLFSLGDLTEGARHYLVVAEKQ
jgi:SAM-dependent methyltransferase